MCETSSGVRPFATDFPGVDEDLPSQIDTLEQNTGTGLIPRIHQPVSAFGSESVGTSGREAQAAYLYMKVLEMTETQSLMATQEGLVQFDNTLQKFLSSVLCQPGATWGLYCGSIGFTMG